MLVIRDSRLGPSVHSYRLKLLAGESGLRLMDPVVATCTHILTRLRLAEGGVLVEL